MNDPAGDAKSAVKQPTITMKLGGLTLTGPSAIVVALLILGLFVGLIIWSKPSLGMWLSGGIWLGFIIFWSVTAQKGGPARTEESVRSRAARQNLMNLGVLFLFVPVPGLRWRFLPAGPWLVPAGLSVQVAAALLHVWARRHLGRNWSSAVMIKTDQGPDSLAVLKRRDLERLDRVAVVGGYEHHQRRIVALEMPRHLEADRAVGSWGIIARRWRGSKHIGSLG